ncbi:MAG: sensor histidine kinase [Flavobacteriales bacterium]|nr:sensor histidine kinase [Flavobacteriales bacterium]MCB9190178.1 sensor histidine kinase [Flavobacteriales bacterium]
MLVFALVCGFANGQSKTDSLLHVHNSGKADATTYADLIWAYVFNQPDSAIYFGNRAQECCEKTGVDSLLGSIYNRIGVAYDIKSMPDSALYWYGLALEHSLKSGNRKTEAGALNNIGLIYWNRGKAEEAIDHYIRSAEIFEEIGNLIGLGNTYNNIALILYEDNQLEKSQRYNRQALRIRKEAAHDYGIAASYSNFAQLYSTEGMMMLDSAIYYLELAIPIKQKLNDQFGLARSYHNLGDIYLTLNRLDESLKYQKMALAIQLRLGNSEGYASTYYNISAVYKALGDDRTQLAYVDTAENYAKENNDLSLLWKVFMTKARVLGRLKRFEEAHSYWMRYDNLKDSVVSLERSKQVEELETRYRTAEQEKEIADKKTSLAEAKLKLENRNKWIFGLLGGLASFLLLGFALFQVYRRRSQAEKDAALISERERGLKAMIEATEEERKRIAKDLHDGIVQSLTGLSLRLQKGFSFLNSLSENDKKEFDDSRKMLDDSIAELRTISHQMMPRVLSEMGLIPALDDMLNKSLGNTNIKYEFEHHKVEGQRFAENVEVSLYRICQELVNNIIKHSDAKAVSVQLLKTKTHLVLVVEDNGKGFNFDDGANQNGIGLMNISSRAKAINGEVNYQPSPEQGTVATIRIPLA